MLGELDRFPDVVPGDAGSEVFTGSDACTRFQRNWQSARSANGTAEQSNMTGESMLARCQAGCSKAAVWNTKRALNALPDQPAHERGGTRRGRGALLSPERAGESKRRNAQQPHRGRDRGGLLG
ncbi:hypothetical protein AAFF_G00389910 [Aldrovandia affinis]|uniref:Uncharacterized protein n=1 Tax=Aldrovandia affinis TaxID=143900 RepID=A0AAD7SED0_9TELE|nr:hypothetical protein AAFF_G00389910 [Aldrovandia affinis]